MAGAVPRLARITPPAWDLDTDELASLFCDKTKLILLNNPQNPSGKAYSSAELQIIADLVTKHNCFAVLDEVYEHLVFDGARHASLMSLPGMRSRCIKIGSAGKTFSLCGWKVGYAAADASIIKHVAKAHQFLTFTTPPNLQRAVAFGLGKGEAYFRGLAAETEAKRDRLAAGLTAAGFDVAQYGLTAVPPP